MIARKLTYPLGVVALILCTGAECKPRIRHYPACTWEVELELVTLAEGCVCDVVNDTVAIGLVPPPKV